MDHHCMLTEWLPWHTDRLADSMVRLLGTQVVHTCNRIQGSAVRACVLSAFNRTYKLFTFWSSWWLHLLRDSPNKINCDSSVKEVMAFGLLACVWLLGWMRFTNWECCINHGDDMRGWWVMNCDGRGIWFAVWEFTWRDYRNMDNLSENLAKLSTFYVFHLYYHWSVHA